MVVLCFAIGLSAVSSSAYSTAAHWVGHGLETQQDLGLWLAAVFDAQANARGYVVSGDPKFLASYEQALEAEAAAVSRLRTKVSVYPGANTSFEAASRAASVITSLLGEWVQAADHGRREEAIRRSVSVDAKSSIEAFERGWRTVWAAEERLLLDRRATARSRARIVNLCTLLLSLASCGLLAYTWRLRHLRERALSSMAQQANQRVQALGDLAAALAQSRTRSDVVDVLIELGMRIAESDTCTLYVLDDTGNTLELLGERGCAPEVIDRIRRISASDGTPNALSYLRSGQALWAETEADYRALFPSLATMDANGPRAQAFWSVPLIAEGRPLGLFAMGFYEPRRFSREDRSLVETLSSQCAQALVRAMRTEREDRARRWLDTTLRSIGDAVIATNSDGQVTFMNPIAERLTGFAEPEAIGKPLDEVFRICSEQTHEPIENPVHKVLREGKVIGLANHTILRSRTGLEIPIDDSGAPIRNEAGQIFGVVLVFRDATPQQRMRIRREFLTKSSEVFVSSLDYQSTLASVARLAVPTIADWCVVTLVDSETAPPYQAAVAHVDPAKLEFARRLGEKYPGDPNASSGAPQVIRTGRSELYAEVPESLIERAATDAEHLKLLAALKLESAMVVPLAGRRRILGALSFIFADSGRHYTTDDLEFAEDFARRAAMAIENAQALKDAETARAQERVQRRNAELASRAKDEFLAVVSHELRTPLNAILGWAVILRGRQPSQEIEHGLAVIERNARAQAKLVEDVLDVSRIVSGKLSLTLKKTNVAQLMHSAVETLAPAADAKNISVITDIPDTNLVITADANRMEQVVWNLLSNAVKFTPRGGSIRLSAYLQGSELEITVADSGEGISPAALPFVFEPFQQADASTTRRHGGLGLGLSIVKHLVAAHGGTVTAMSDGEGKGARFRVLIPITPSHESSITLARSVGTGVGIEPRLKGLKILLVDDEPDALELLGELLRKHGAETHLAASAPDGLQQFTGIRPDLVLSDIGMPVMDGFSFMQAIRAMPSESGGQTPAIAITAYARTEDAERAVAVGYQAHVAKPIDPVELVRVIAEVVEPR